MSNSYFNIEAEINVDTTIEADVEVILELRCDECGSEIAPVKEDASENLIMVTVQPFCKECRDNWTVKAKELSVQIREFGYKMDDLTHLIEGDKS